MNVEAEEDRGGKRRREDQDEPQRHDVLWFLDGNVVLATDKYLFKVFKGVLSMHSSVFKDMFELPGVGESSGGQSGDERVQEMYEGVPKVTLVGDNGEEVAHLLRALYEHRYYDSHNRETPVAVVVALLRLGAKYDFGDLLRDAVKQISRRFPMALQALDSIMKQTHPIFGAGQYTTGLLLLQAAYEAGVDALLPVLFFFCSNMPMITLLKKTHSMSIECLRILIKGRDDLMIASSKLVSALPYYLTVDMGDGKCLDKSPCIDKACYDELSDLITPFFCETQGREVVENYLTFVCKKCGSTAAKSIDEKRQEIWAKVPSYYGYSGWEDAKAKLKEFIDS